MFTAMDLALIVYFCSAILLAIIQTCSAFRHFQSQIPNGAKVLNPCNNHEEWAGVGHRSKEGRNARNPFGADFSAHGKTWTKVLCQLDSDGDGVSNGEELGDPDCIWKPGMEPSGPAKSHPGVCEPLSDPRCSGRNTWLDCNKVSNLNQVICPSIKSNATFNKDLRLDPTPVPSKETTYFCQIFDLNITSDLHMVATQPLIQHSEVVHHILMFGCAPKNDNDIGQKLRSPYECEMVPHDACRSLIGAWTIGSPGECAHPDMGFRVGPRGYKTVAIQIHWNNPQLLQGITDSSGLKIYLTKSLRKYDAGMLVIGQQYLQIESNQGRPEAFPDISYSATCPERCTKVMFSTPVYITQAVNHMHYLGKSQDIKVYKNNSLVKTITDQENYDYDSPRIHTFSEPVQINPGDEIRTTCVYKRTSTKDPVCWGEATSQEMCFGFITYYPLQSLSHPWCTSIKSFPSCERHLPALTKQPFDECRWWEFRDPNNLETVKRVGQILALCYPGKSGQLNCSKDCQEIARTVADHPCIKGETGSYMIDRFKHDDMTKQLLNAVITCSCRHFSYCDRKTTTGLLGSKQQEYCSSVSGNSSSSTHFQSSSLPPFNSQRSSGVQQEKSGSLSLQVPSTLYQFSIYLSIVLFSMNLWVSAHSFLEIHL